ncbi:MAG: hypothetical protein ACI9W4_000709 [Rhodothermales bacterium]|jgi:hypothetical protein
MAAGRPDVKIGISYESLWPSRLGFALHPTQNLMVLDGYIPEEKEFEGFRVTKLWE